MHFEKGSSNRFLGRQTQAQRDTRHSRLTYLDIAPRVPRSKPSVRLLSDLMQEKNKNRYPPADVLEMEPRGRLPAGCAIQITNLAIKRMALGRFVLEVLFLHRADACIKMSSMAFTLSLAGIGVVPAQCQASRSKDQKTHCDFKSSLIPPNW